MGYGSLYCDVPTMGGMDGRIQLVRVSRKDTITRPVGDAKGNENDSR